MINYVILLLILISLSLDCWLRIKNLDKKTRLKRMGLTTKDIKFLNDLQHELINQDHVGQAAPRFWVVAGSKKVYVGNEYATDEELVDEVDEIASNLSGAVEYFIEYIAENYNSEEYDIIIKEDEMPLSFCLYQIDKHCDKNAPDYEEGDEIVLQQQYISSIDELISTLELIGVLREGRHNYSAAGYRIERCIYPNTMFLTNRECKQHIAANHYHYSDDAHSYAMTAWRSYEVETLWKLLEKIQWDNI